MIVETTARIEYTETLTIEVPSGTSKKEAVKQAETNIKEYCELRGLNRKNFKITKQEVKQ